MFKLIKFNRFFFFPYFVLLIFGVWILGKFSKSEIMIWVNQHTYPAWDGVFVFLTYIGDGLAFTVLALILLWFRFRLSIQAWLIFGLSSLVSQGLKKFLFPHSPRPLAYFRAYGLSLQEIRWVSGVPIYLQNSFPSGHSLTGFSLALLICFWVKNKVFALPCLILAVGIAYSRMYLFEHFLTDCLAGSLIGVTLTTLAYYYLEKNSWPNAAWADKGIKDWFVAKKKE